jgi:hypothetical protein
MKKHFLVFLFVIVSIYSYSQSTYLTSNQLSYRTNPNSFTTNKTNTLEGKWFFKPPRAAPTDDKVFVDFVGSGDIQKSVSEGKDINANTGLGIIFERFSGIEKIIQSFELEGTINIATTADTIKSKIDNNVLQNGRNFGTYILNPISARQSLYINSNIYFGYPKKDQDKLTIYGRVAKTISGINVRVISSNNIWQYDNVTKNLGVLAFRVGVFHEFIPDNYRLSKENRSKNSLFIGLNYAYRGVFGDISSTKEDELRTKILGSSQTAFHGIEANFGFRLNNLRAEFQMPILKPSDKSIDGLTNTQFQFSIKFVGGFALKINDSVESE